MDKHRDIKVTGGKGPGDVLQVHSDLVDAGFVVRGVGKNLYHAAIFGEKKMVGDFFLIEAHALVAALFQVLVVRGFCVLGGTTES